MRTLIDNVIQWAYDRNIIEGSTPIKQLDKTSEEFNELQRAVALHEFVLDSISWSNADLADAYRKDVVDAYGDVLVTLIISAQMQCIDLEDALAAAYEEIKDRRGEMRGGKFVKEADL